MRGAAIALTLVACAGCGFEPRERFREAVENPEAEFTEYTGLDFPDSARILAVGDTHGGLNGDGEFYLAFEADKETIQAWLDQEPPWGQPAWLPGPVPGEIANHCMDAPRDGMDSDRIHYIAQDFKRASIPWHNGRLLVLDPARGRVVLSWWDF
jgi:hypothetical protein